MAVIEKTMMAMVVAMMGVLILAQVVQGMTPQKTFCCPVCGECFYTQEELTSHLAEVHPEEPTAAIWEYSNVQCQVVLSGVGEWMGIDYSATITNTGSIAVTRIVSLWRRIYYPMEDTWSDWMVIKPEEVTLEPGESYVFTCPASAFLIAYNSTIYCYLMDDAGYQSEMCEASLGATSQGG